MNEVLSPQKSDSFRKKRSVVTSSKQSRTNSPISEVKNSRAVKLLQGSSIYLPSPKTSLSYIYRNCFLMGNTVEKPGGQFIFTFFSSFNCRDSFTEKMSTSKSKIWAFYPSRPGLTQLTVQYINSVQDAMNLSSSDRSEAIETECGKAVAIMSSPFWSSNVLRISFLSLLCRAAKHFDPNNGDLIAPLEKTIYTRSKGSLYAARRFIFHKINPKNIGNYLGWRDTFYDKTEKQIDSILSEKYTNGEITEGE